jgi:hypothetical protein
MLTSFGKGRSDYVENVGCGNMTPVQSRENLAKTPADPHSVVLWMIGELRDQFDEPIEHEMLAWHLDNPSPEESEVVKNAVVEGDSTTRREYLFLILGDLVDFGLITQNPSGLYLTNEGSTVLEDLRTNMSLNAR